MLHLRMREGALSRTGHPWLVRACFFVLREAGSVLSKAVMFVAIMAVFALMVLDDFEVDIPFLSARMEQRIEDRIGGNVEIGAIRFSLGSGERPAGVSLINVALQNEAGATMLTAPEIRSDFAMIDLAKGKLRPQSFAVSGAKLYLRRDANGRISMALGDDVPGADKLPGHGIPDMRRLGSVAEVAALPLLEQLQVVSFDDISVSYEDLLTGNRWSADHGRVEIRRTDGGVSGVMEAGFSRSGDTPTHVFVRADQRADGSNAVLAEFFDAAPTDIADHVAALDWLRIIDAPAKGNLTLELDAEGQLTAFNGAIALDEGRVRPEGTQEIGFESARSHFSYDPAAQLFTVDNLSVATSVADIASRGSVRLTPGETGGIAALTGQMRITALNIRKLDVFPQDLSFERGEITARATLDPFRIDIGEIVLFDSGNRLIADGSVRAAPEAWQVAVNLRAEGIAHDRLLAYWPLALKPKTRTWLEENIQAGTITRLQAGLRTTEDKPDLLLEARFEDATARVLRSMPPVTGASGRVSVAENAVRVTVDAGLTTPPSGAPIDLAGTVFEVPDTRPKPATGIAHVRATGGIPGILSLLDLEPLNLISKLGQSPDFATGRAEATARLEFPLQKGLPPEAVIVAADATLTDLEVPNLIPNRPVSAERLHLAATNTDLRLSGIAEISDIPFDFTFARALGPEADPVAHFDGTFPMSPATLAALGAALPTGLVRGETEGRLQLALEKDVAPQFTLLGDVGPLAISVPSLSYGKSAGRGSGVVELTGSLGETPQIDRLRLEAPGLLAEGRIDLAGAGLRSAEFSRLRVGGWLDAPVRLDVANRQVRISGGTVDLRNFNRGGAGSSGPGYQISLAPVDLIVTDGIALRGVEGEFTTAGGLKGRFNGRVNGGARVAGIVQRGNKVYLYADHAGQALKDAGLFEGGRGGELRAALLPDAQTGGYNGLLMVSNIRVSNAPVLAEILSVASIVGAVDALSGSGVSFEHVESDFRILPERIVVDRAHAISASLGVTMNGTYAPRSGKLDLEGVVSPFYFINGAFAQIPLLGRILGGRNGEGLIGVNYALAGTRDNPRIAVNPVSGLTPGVLREIFQRRPEAAFSPEAIARQKQ